MQKPNSSQLKAISHVNGPMMVIAGPGSGKTFVITKRVRFLVEEKKINPSHILVITFTKAAAKEMQERYENLTGKKDGRVTFGTFHAVFFKILKLAYGYNAGHIIKEEKKYEMLQHILNQTDVECEDEKELIQAMIADISMVKNERISLEHFYPASCGSEVFRNVYNNYHLGLRRQNLLDFDDIILNCFTLLKERKDILAAWQNKYRYILIDEFQDINQIQYDVINLLAKPDENLFIVGDDDQSIYRFRGAKPEIMLYFSRDYPKAEKVILDTNYRSTIKIIKASDKVIRHNEKRFGKAVLAYHNAGENVKISCYETQALENQDIINKLLQNKNSRKKYGDAAILYRTNGIPRAIIGKLIEYNIPFRVKDRVPNLFEHWICKNIITYIKISQNILLACGKIERKDFLQIMNKPNRYIKRDSLINPVVKKEELMEYYKEKDWMQERIERLFYDFTMLGKMNPYAAVHYIRKGIGYDDYIKEYADMRNMKEDELFSVMNELMDSAKEHRTVTGWFDYRKQYEEKLKKEQPKSDEDAVTLATFHGAKGLEFEQVYILDAIEGITPYKKAILPADMEEERRMFYVAMTRAKSKLQICYAKEYLGKKTTPSQFVRELLT